MISIESLFLIGALLILFSVMVARAFDNFGVPTVILFLIVGMIAGENGVGRLHFNDYHIAKSAGIAALAVTMVIGPRRGWMKEPMPPHNLPFTMLGMGILWFGWFGFNAGSALTSDGVEFQVRVNGTTYWRLLTSATQWIPASLDLSRWRGQNIVLQLVTGVAKVRVCAAEHHA